MFKDLSYNNFSDSSIPTLCRRNNLNLYRSSSRKMNSKLSVCLDSFPCSKDLYSLYINCSGNVTTVGKTTYQSDIEPGGPATFIPSIPEWGFSSSGHFWFLQLPNANFITTNDTDLHIDDVELYTEGRVSGTSLTYYGRCLAEGNYVVTLHFAEIVFRDNNSFYSLGRRIFDVYIQENLVLKDFDITKEANGTDKAVKKTFKHVSVMNSGTIEIRLFYAGKGTVFIPWRGIYGPFISAISVKSEFSHGPWWEKTHHNCCCTRGFTNSNYCYWCYYMETPISKQAIKGRSPGRARSENRVLHFETNKSCHK